MELVAGAMNEGKILKQSVALNAKWDANASHAIGVDWNWTFQLWWKSKRADGGERISEERIADFRDGDVLREERRDRCMDQNAPWFTWP